MYDSMIWMGCPAQAMSVSRRMKVFITIFMYGQQKAASRVCFSKQKSYEAVTILFNLLHDPIYTIQRTGQRRKTKANSCNYSLMIMNEIVLLRFVSSCLVEIL